MKKHVTIIAEAGVNHNGKLDLAIELVKVAKAAGADYVKFQTFVTEEIVTKDAHQAEYQTQNTGQNKTQYEMLKGLELSFENHIILKDLCSSLGIGFLSTAFDQKSFEFLKGLNLDLWKIPSGELTNLPFLEQVANCGKPIVLSTGMANLEEIEDSLKVFQKIGVKKDDITVLHCNTNYPAQMNEVNLLAMKTIADKFHVNVGYSDHTEGIEVAIAAVALGATVIEKHFTLDRNLPGPDHKCSLEPQELKTMISSIRNIEDALGSNLKKASSNEEKNISVARKSIVAKKQIKKGELFTVNNLTTKRPGTGISPMQWYSVLGQPAQKDYQEDDLI